jgi:hypothetical protein
MQFVRVDANNGTILLMDSVHLVHKLAARSLENIEVKLVPFRCGCNLRTGKFGKGVKVEAIDHETDRIHKSEYGKTYKEVCKRWKVHVDDTRGLQLGEVSSVLTSVLSVEYQHLLKEPSQLLCLLTLAPVDPNTLLPDSRGSCISA